MNCLQSIYKLQEDDERIARVSERNRQWKSSKHGNKTGKERELGETVGSKSITWKKYRRSRALP